MDNVSLKPTCFRIHLVFSDFGPHDGPKRFNPTIDWRVLVRQTKNVPRLCPCFLFFVVRHDQPHLRQPLSGTDFWFVVPSVVPVPSSKSAQVARSLTIGRFVPWMSSVPCKHEVQHVCRWKPSPSWPHNGSKESADAWTNSTPSLPSSDQLSLGYWNCLTITGFLWTNLSTRTPSNDANFGTCFPIHPCDAVEFSTTAHTHFLLDHVLFWCHLDNYLTDCANVYITLNWFQGKQSPVKFWILYPRGQAFVSGFLRIAFQKIHRSLHLKEGNNLIRYFASWKLLFNVSFNLDVLL